MDTNIGNVIVEFDISSTETPDYEELCVLNTGYENGVNMDTWNDLCSAHSNTVATSLDEAWPFTFKFDKSDPVALFIKDKKNKTGLARTAKIKITDKLENKVVSFTATFGDINYTFESDSVLEIECQLKIYKNSTYSEVAYVAPSV